MVVTHIYTWHFVIPLELSPWKFVWPEQHLETIFVSPSLAVFELFDQIITKFLQTFVFQTVHLKMQVRTILAQSIGIEYLQCCFSNFLIDTQVKHDTALKVCDFSQWPMKFTNSMCAKYRKAIEACFGEYYVCTPSFIVGF